MSGGLATSGGLENGFRWSEHVSPSGRYWRVIWRSGVCPDVYADIDTGWKVQAV